MRAVNADEPCWGFGPKPRLAGFWIRRQAHEHAVHHADLQHALGADPVGLAGLLRRRRRRGPGHVLPAPGALRPYRTGGRTILFRTADTEHAWTVGGTEPSEPGQAEPVATVTASAEDLYLGLWKRRDLLETAKVEGDTAAVQQALNVALTP